MTSLNRYDEHGNLYDRLSRYDEQGNDRLYDEYRDRAMLKRVGNADRDRYVDHLSNMLAEGYLKQSEFDTRRDEALSARTVGGLNKTIEHLPAIPEKPAPPRTRVTYQVAGNWRFSAWRFGSLIALGVSLCSFPGPLLAHAYGGFDHSPGAGVLPVLLIVLGVFTIIIGGVTCAPDHSRWEDRCL